jgi:hypothetical protein
MQTITSSAGLKNAIQLLEVEKAINEQLLKEQFYVAIESIKPFNILKSTFKEISSSSSFIDNVLGTTMGLATGYFTKKIFVGLSGNLIRKALGAIMQLGVTNVVAQHPDTIISFGRSVIQHFFRKKETNSKSSD